MNYLFVGQVIPFDIYNNDKFSDNRVLADTAGNNFYNHLLTGLAENGYDVEAISRVNSEVVEKYGKNAVLENVNYILKKNKKNFIIKHLSLLWSTFFEIKKWYKKDGELIVNCLRITQCISALLAKKIFGLKITAVVTDVPKHRVFDTNKSLITKITDKLGSYMLSKYDKYVFLSEDMNPLINKDDKPYVVIEGLINPDLFEGIKEEKYDDFTLMYAGALAEKYNIMSLVDAVINSDNPIRLIIYGSGELEERLTKISAVNSKIEYRGQASYTEVLREETKVHLLVNPRSTDEEYTRLSFPSKNIEYMLSGTPVLYTRLKSMPKEYYEHIFVIDDESADGIKNKIDEIYAYSPERLKSVGAGAKQFIQTHKSRKMQAKKIIGTDKNE